MSTSSASGDRPPSDSLVERLAAEPGEAATLRGIVEVSVETIPGCDHAGLTVRHDDRFETLAATAPVVREADDVQYSLREGPCVAAVWTDDVLLIDDMATDTRFPRWAPRAMELGIRSSLSVRLTETRGGRQVSGLNLYATSAHAFDDDDVQLAHAYAARAAAALAVSREIAGLKTALQSRHVIGVAQGILVARHQVSVDSAFKVLVRLSRDSNTKLVDVAEEVVAARGIPPRPGTGAGTGAGAGDPRS